MVQVDVVWAYAFGASFAAASARQIVKEPKPLSGERFTFLLLFLAVLFGPSGLYLLTAFPSWETMQLANQVSDVPPWLVTLFALINITQGILGYYVSARLIRSGRIHAAYVNWVAAWAVIWFILVSGWDTLDWQRFLYDRSLNNDVPWQAGAHMDLAFILSPVALTLAGIGVFFAPALIYGMVVLNLRDLRADHRLSAAEQPAALVVLVLTFAIAFGGCVAMAIAAALIVAGIAALSGSLGLAYGAGLPLAIGLSSWVLRPSGRCAWLLRQLYAKDPATATKLATT